MAYALLGSLLLHAVLLSAPLWALHRQARQQRTEQLVVQLYGMLAARQSEARATSAAAPAAAPPVPARARALLSPAPPRSAPAPKATPALAQDQAAPAAAAAVAAAAAAAPPPAPSVAPSVTPAPPNPVNNALPAQQASTVAAHDTAVVAIKRYLAAVRRQLQAHLIYPDGAKQGGYEGTPVVGFTLNEDGSILPGSLTLVHSSGHAGLDANALQAARDSTPFEPPTHRMDVAIAVAFRLSN